MNEVNLFCFKQSGPKSVNCTHLECLKPPGFYPLIHLKLFVPLQISEPSICPVLAELLRLHSIYAFGIDTFFTFLTCVYSSLFLTRLLSKGFIFTAGISFLGHYTNAEKYDEQKRGEKCHSSNGIQTHDLRIMDTLLCSLTEQPSYPLMLEKEAVEKIEQPLIVLVRGCGRGYTTYSRGS